MKQFEKAFEEYLRNYDKGVKEIRFKYSHCFRVEELMEELAKKLKLDKEKTEVAKIIGLLHDIGRFEQVKLYSRCSDAKTGVDHADESCVYLFDKGHIRDFVKDDKYDQVIYDAIKNHNKREIDKKVKGESLFFAKMIRDMDKTDIYRVLAEEYTFEFNKDDVSKNVIESVKKEETVDIHDKKTKSDEIMSYFAFLYDVNYKESFEILKKTNNFIEFLNVVTPIKGSEEELSKLKNKYIKFIEDVK